MTQQARSIQVFHRVIVAGADDHRVEPDMLSQLVIAGLRELAGTINAQPTFVQALQFSQHPCNFA